ncbi:WXG100 family type VII secretion target [Actinoplanes utahensis]|uniref:Excreted virulence factor EspC (Type VII ESX diderm) n=1 Tax=Actinoplanes utahensis TaxID=1869 RepID=A0A0A6UTY2_ACTUT|nr:type VII secretion target [Actinoplanes utahensis]KHD77909.1 hypothetical protein MB27_08520 [Actinoplanes utahensis]GIF32502.1 hypothetical protein Aut01nite_54880 [Actinoplanes utahensis]
MGTEEVRVEPVVLEAAARVCAELADRVKESNRDVGPETEAAMTGLGGWKTRYSLELLATAWTDDAEDLAGYLSALGDALSGCARDYQHTDRATAALFDITRGR